MSDDAARPSFRELLERARAGEDGAWDQVFNRLGDEGDEGAELLAIGRRLLPPRDRARRLIDSRDLVQTALRSGWIDARQFDGESEAEFFGWMRTILRRKLAQKTRRKRLPVKDGGDDPLGGVADRDQGTPSVELARAESSDRVRAALDTLNEDQRAVIELRLRGLDAPAIARELGLTPEAVRMRASRAMKQIKDLLGEDG